MGIKIKINTKALSINSCFKGRRFKNTDCKNYDKYLQFTLPKKKVKADYYHIIYSFYLKKYLSTDWDNMIKVLQDNLVKKGIIEDDRYILKAEVEKIKAEKDYIIIEIKEYNLKGVEK